MARVRIPYTAGGDSDIAGSPCAIVIWPRPSSVLPSTPIRRIWPSPRATDPLSAPLGGRRLSRWGSDRQTSLGGVGQSRRTRGMARYWCGAWCSVRAASGEQHRNRSGSVEARWRRRRRRQWRCRPLRLMSRVEGDRTYVSRTSRSKSEGGVARYITTNTAAAAAAAAAATPTESKSRCGNGMRAASNVPTPHPSRTRAVSTLCFFFPSDLG